MLPRQRRTPILPGDGVQPTDTAGHETFRPSATGAFPQRAPTPIDAASLDSLPDVLSVVRDKEEGDAPRTDLV